ncbi:MAG: Regulatory protein RepA [Chloroflexi bacterium]|nr:Regulatory protein RepA [Chloroflexota bacterium]
MRADLLSELVALMKAAGLDPPRRDIDRFKSGSTINFSTGTKPVPDTAGYLSCSERSEGVVGFFGSHRASHPVYETFFLPYEKDKEVKSGYRRKASDPAQIEEDRRRREDAEKSREGSRLEAKSKAEALWGASTDAISNPYLLKKHLQNHVNATTSLAQIDASLVKPLIGYAPRRDEKPLSGSLLIVPLFNASSEMVNVELIAGDSLKVSLYGGPRRACFWPTRLLRDGETIGLAEGVATAMSIDAALNIAVVSVGGCGNFAPVIESLAKEFPKSRFIVFSDLGNGQSAANIAAKLHKAHCIAPPESLRQTGGTDFNDLFVISGADGVLEHIMPSLPEVIVDPCALPGLPPGKRRVDFTNIRKLPDVRWVLPGLLEGSLGMIVGQGSIGKSFLALQVSMALSTGLVLPWLDPFDDFRRIAGGVGTIFGEDDDDIIERRAFSIMEEFPIYREEEYRALLGRNIHIYGLVGHDIRIASQERFEITDGPFLADLADFCSGKRLVIIDPLTRMLDGDENDNRAAGAMMTRLARVANQTRCSIVALHHVGKTNNNDREEWAASRGASALTTSVRYQLNIRPVNEEEFKNLNCEGRYEDERTNYIALIPAKVNYGKPMKKSFMRRGKNGVLHPLSLPIGMNPPSSASIGQRKPAPFTRGSFGSGDD